MASDPARDGLLNELQRYATPFEEEASFVSRFVHLIENFPNCFGRELSHGHITGSAWIVDETVSHVLMTHHAKLNKWLQLGGHADGESDIKNVALREALEESGLRSVRPLSPNIFDLDIHSIPTRKNEPFHEHFDIRYLFVADKTEHINFNHESKKVDWIFLGELDELTGSNRSIMRMVEKCMPIKGNCYLYGK